MKAIKVTVKGHPTYIGLSTKIERSMEQETREWQIFPISREDKFKAVVESIAYQNPLTDKVKHEETEILKQAIVELKRWMQMPVMNFYMPEVIKLFKKYDPRIQRDVKRLKSLIDLIPNGWVVRSW